MMILTKRSKKVIQIAAVLGTAGVLLSGLSAAIFAPQPSSQNSNGSSSQLQLQTDVNGNIIQP